MTTAPQEAPRVLLTFDPGAVGKASISGSVAQHPPLVVDDRLEHLRVLDVSGRDHNAAVHEVGDGGGHVLVRLGQEGLQTEDLGRSGWIKQRGPKAARLFGLSV